MSKVFEVDNFLTKDECNSLIDYQKKHSVNNIEDWSLYNHDSNWNNRIVILDKIDNDIISRPMVQDKKMYVIKDNSIIKLS